MRPKIISAHTPIMIRGEPHNFKLLNIRVKSRKFLFSKGGIIRVEAIGAHHETDQEAGNMYGILSIMRSRVLQLGGRSFVRTRLKYTRSGNNTGMIYYGECTYR